MSKVWISRILQDSRYGDKQGLREKFYGHDWEKPTHLTPTQPPEVNDAMQRHGKGETLTREEFPEAAYVFSERHFSRVGDYFYICGFVAVKGKLAEVLADADLGTGGLVPFPIYQEDKKTLVDGKSFFLNFGAQKNSFLLSESNQKFLEPLLTLEKNGVELWKVKAGFGNNDIAVSPAALIGADIWFEPKVWRKLFISDRLVASLRSSEVKTDFSLKRCRIVEEK